MKTVFNAAFQEEAKVLKSILDSAGINAELMADSMLDVNPYFVIEPKGVQIVVPDDQEEDAKAIVADFKMNKKDNLNKANQKEPTP
ncbi:MAG: DUF2007 domain-containing protein [Rectinema sp.]